MAKRPKLVLIDGNSIFHRGYHAMPGLTNTQGVPTSGIYGFALMALRILGDLKPDYVIVAWDKAKTSIAARTKIYPEYKIQRKQQADDFYAQIPYVRQLAEALGWPLLELDNYEADDIIGALASQAKNLETIIVTSDLDALQLVDNHVKVYALRRGLTDFVIYDRDKIHERYGLTPEQFIDYKALRGDASDNIPGVSGIGEKTAAELIQKYGSLDSVYAHLGEHKGRLRERLEQDKETAYLSQKLVRIMNEAPVKLELDKAKTTKIDRAKAYDLFRELEFKSLLDKLPGEVQTAPSLFDRPAPAKQRTHLKSVKYHCVQAETDLKSLVKQLDKVSTLAFDVETDDFDIMNAHLVGLSFSWIAGEAYYVPLGHRGIDSQSQQLPAKQVIKVLKPILENPEILKVGHNVKFDYEILRRHGVSVSPISFDSMVAAFLLNPLGRAMALEDLVYRELGLEMIPIEELIGRRGKNQASFDLTAIEDATRYAAEDADMSWRLYQHLAPQLEESGLHKLAQDVEWPLIPILAEMELTGIMLDKAVLGEINRRISTQIMGLEEKIHDHAGQKFNISSPGQLAQILFERLGLSKVGIKKGKTGFSTAASELDKIRGAHPIIDLIGEHRELVKLKTTYVDALPLLVKNDGRIHTSYNQTIAQTGRLSSTNPNLQNIPIRTEAGRQIRRAFVAPKGRVLIGADYSQFELRIAAALSQDQGLMRAFEEGIDLHQQTAAEMYGLPLAKVTKEQRYAAKTINFGVLYGMGPHGLSVATGMTHEEAGAFIQRYYELRPALKEYVDRVKRETKEREYAETIFGRRRPLPEINSNNYMIASGAERMAVNVPIQGTQADLMKMAMIKLAPKLTADTQMLLQIHDELIVETDKTKGEQMAELIKETLESVYDLGVPIVVETSIGQNWSEL